MNKTLVISDLHLGVQRTGGTTLASAIALREYGHSKHLGLLNLAPKHNCNRIVVNGDLADAYDIPLGQALEIYAVADAFLSQNPDIELIWGLGNHDLSKDSAKLGTVAFVGALLEMKHRNFTLVKEAGIIDGTEMYIIPHVANQDLFNMELKQIPVNMQWLLVHANLDNSFACDADHSLDMSRDQAKALLNFGMRIVFGHEHQGREILGGKVIVVGNQFPTSVSDCLKHGDGQRDGTKRCMVIDHDANTHEFIQTWSPDDADGWYAEVDWRELATIEEEGRGFVRVSGEALASEAANVIKSISGFRQRSNSFVVTNAVKIEKVEGLDDLSESIEDIRSVNVLDLLLDHLDAEQAAAIKTLLEGCEK